MSKTEIIDHRQRAQDLHEALRETVFKHYGHQMSAPEAAGVIGAIAGLAGVYLSPFDIEDVVHFGNEVRRYYLEARENGAGRLETHSRN